MSRTIEGMIEAGEPLIREALEALRAYHDALDGGAPPEEVERLRQLADSLYQLVTDFQLYALGHQALVRH